MRGEGVYNEVILFVNKRANNTHTTAVDTCTCTVHQLFICLIQFKRGRFLVGEWTTQHTLPHRLR